MSEGGWTVAEYGVEPIGYPEFMRGMCNAPWDDDKCGSCGGAGLKAVYCCNGAECGCRGMPIDFVVCGCGNPEPTRAQIKGWAHQ